MTFTALLAAATCAGLASPALAQYTSVVSAGAGSGAERCVTGGVDTSTGSRPGSQAVGQDGGLCANTGAPAHGNYSQTTSVAQLFADSQGATLTRVPDAGDETWIANPGAGVFGIGRSAANSFTLGYLPGATGPLSGYTQLLGAIGSSSTPEVFLPASFITTLPASENRNGDLATGVTQGLGLYNAPAGDSVYGTPDFSAAPSAIISTPGDSRPFRFAIFDGDPSHLETWSSLPSDNVDDGADHMVTWQLNSAALTAAHETEYVASFENAAFPGADGDYNDYTFVFLNVIPNAGPLPPTVPEPATWAMMLLGVAVTGTMLRRRRTATVPV